MAAIVLLEICVYLQLVVGEVRQFHVVHLDLTLRLHATRLHLRTTSVPIIVHLVHNLKRLLLNADNIK